MASLVAASPGAANDGGLLALLIPTLKNTFIGSAIALMATAILCLYVIRVIDIEPVRSSSRRPWEIMVVSALMIAAVLVSLAASYIAGRNAAPLGLHNPLADRLTVSSWTLFMLSGSLAFAYGLIYHGLFKDIDKLDDRTAALEAAIARNATPPTLDAIRRQRAALPKGIRLGYASERFWLESLSRRHRIASIFGIDIDKARFLTLFAKVFGKVGQFTIQAPIEMDGVLPIDREIASELVSEIGRLKLQKTMLDGLLAELDQTIAEKRARAKWAEIDQLEAEAARLRGVIAGSPFDDEAAQAVTYISEERLHAQLLDAVTAARMLQPAFDPVRRAAIRAATARGVSLSPSISVKGAPKDE